ncbi:MAG: alpha-glycosidase, partial [Clostridia bacterium]|nr:alpha-glycosidase [Clostridia bacterium]
NTKQVNSMMLNLLDSHDTHRFYTLLNKDLDKLICALSIIYIHTGAPCIYYGTEVPLEGGYDPDCRRTMDWKDEHRKTYLKSVISSLAKLRSRKEVIDGDISFKAEGELFILERVLKNAIRLTVNNSGENKPFNAEGKILLSHNYTGGTITNKGFVIEEIKSKKEENR